MASPIDSARVATNIATAATSHLINVGSPVSGTLLIVAIRYAADPGTVTFTGYTLLVSDATDAALGTTAVYYRWATGSEGVDDPLTTTNSVKLAAVNWEITGAFTDFLLDQNPQVSAVAIGTTTANTCNPGSRAVTGGPTDCLFIAIGSCDGESQTFTGPTSYANATTANSGTGGATNTNARLGGSTRAVTAATSEDPGVFTHAAAITGWSAFTVCVYSPAVLEQGAYRFRNNDGTETAATWRQALNTPDTIPLDTPFRLRLLVNNSNGVYNEQFRLHVRRKPSGGAFGAWAAIGGASTVFADASAHFAEGDATTQQISGGSFVAGKMAETSNLSGVVSVTSGVQTELEWCLEARAASGAALADEYEFRLVRILATVLLNTYTQTPTLTIGTAGPFTYTKAGYGVESA